LHEAARHTNYSKKNSDLGFVAKVGNPNIQLEIVVTEDEQFTGCRS
jgi:hypothetical protein